MTKLRKLVRKIRKSTKLRQKLKKLCIFHGVRKLQPIIDVKTRWNSSYKMIERAEELKITLNALCSSEKSLSNLLISSVEWDELKILKELLSKSDRATKFLSMERRPTISAYLPTIHWLISSLDHFIKNNSGSLAAAAKSAQSKLKEYNPSIEKCEVPFVATFLNPALKLTYFKEQIPDTKVQKN